METHCIRRNVKKYFCRLITALIEWTDNMKIEIK